MAVAGVVEQGPRRGVALRRVLNRDLGPECIILSPNDSPKEGVRRLHFLTSTYHLFTNACVLGHLWHFATPWAIALQALLSMGFPREEYWSGLPFPSPGHLPYPGIKPRSPGLQADSLLSESPWKPPRDRKE